MRLEVRALGECISKVMACGGCREDLMSFPIWRTMMAANAFALRDLEVGSRRVHRLASR